MAYPSPWGSHCRKLSLTPKQWNPRRLSVVSGPAPTAACGHLLRTQTGTPECPAKPERKCAKSTRPGAAPTWELPGSLHTESASSKARPEWQQSVRAF